MNNQIVTIQVPYHREKQIAFIMRRRWRFLPIYFLYVRREESFAGGKLISDWRGPFFGWQRTRAFMAAISDQATKLILDDAFKEAMKIGKKTSIVYGIAKLSDEDMGIFTYD